MGTQEHREDTHGDMHGDVGTHVGTWDMHGDLGTHVGARGHKWGHGKTRRGHRAGPVTTGTPLLTHTNTGGCRGMRGQGGHGGLGQALGSFRMSQGL